MYLQLRGDELHKANQILYILYSVEKNSYSSLSKLGLQKLIYLSAVLAPAKKIILSIVQFKREQRGPYSKDIQNIVDHLVACGLVDVVEFKVTYKNNSIAYYRISKGGMEAVKRLILIEKESEKYWWMDMITRLSIVFSEDEGLDSEKELVGIDKIVRLVYEDLDFKSVENDFGVIIDAERSTLSASLIEFTHTYITQNAELLDFDDKDIIELVIMAYFEFLHSKYLDKLWKSNSVK
ncbi:MAG: hypothetical protein HWE07_00755 [Cytophagia bacterium]|nr:hypothetical protein [Cytophagia bacterium]